MFHKVILVLSLVTLTFGGLVQQHVEPADVDPHYGYSYSVNDVLTGDSKSHVESRVGEDVQGEYTVLEQDGTLRTVTYTAGRGGFNAVVNRKAGFSAPLPIYDNKIEQNIIPVDSFVQHQKLVPAPQHKVQFIQQRPQQVVVQPVHVPQQVIHQQPQPIHVPQQVIHQQPQPIHVPQQVIHQRPQPVFVPEQQQQVFVEEPQQIPAQQEFQDDTVEIEHHIPVQEQQPLPVQQRPQPVPVQQRPQPFPVQQPQPIPVQQQPRPFPQQPQQQPAPVQHVQDPDQADDSPAIVVEASGRSAQARRAGTRSASAQNPGAFTYSSRGRAYDFNISY